MKFVIQVNSSPYDCQAGESSYQFIMALLDQGHRVSRVFFYNEGIYHAFRYLTPPDDERKFSQRWSELGKEFAIDLVVCVSAAQRRGLLETGEAKRQRKLDDDLADGFRISGLGQLVDAIIKADRFVVFGGQ